MIPKMNGFLSDHESEQTVVSITVEPKTIYFEESRDSLDLNFDFVITGLTERRLHIRFIKVAVYDKSANLATFKHLNHNGVGTPGIYTIGKFEINGQETLDVFNPFHKFPKQMEIGYLRYMFTFYDPETKTEFYYGNIIVTPVLFKQKVKLSIPLRGVLTILDGHDFYSHHRRFAMSLVRAVTGGKFTSNFSRYSIDFTVVGPDGNTREMNQEEFDKNYDFHFSDVTKFYTHEVTVFAPAEGVVVEVIDDLEDLINSPFDMELAIKEDKIKEIAGNYIIIKHNEGEFSHLFHLLKNSIEVTLGQEVERGQPLAKTGFSGAATTYSHLHYQLMDGPDFLNDNPLPCKFSDVTLVLGSKKVRYEELSIDTGDFIQSNFGVI